MFALDITSLHISVLSQFSDELCRTFPEQSGRHTRRVLYIRYGVSIEDALASEMV